MRVTILRAHRQQILRQAITVLIRTTHPLDRPDPNLERAAKAKGFSLHADGSLK